MFLLNMWSQGWPKHVAVCCIYKLISVYFCKCVGSIILRIQLTHGSCIIQMKLLFHSKHKSSLSQLDSKYITEVTVYFREDNKKHIRTCYKQSEVSLNVAAHTFMQ
jgi:hypothetical protein